MYQHTFKVSQLLAVAVNILNLLEHMTPIVDSNLYRVYCSEFNTNRNVNEIDSNTARLLKKYIYDNLISRTRQIVKDLEWLIEDDVIDTMLVLPTVVKDSLDDTIVSSITLNNAVDPVVRLKDSLVENSRLQSAIFHATDREYGGRELNKNKNIMPNINKELLQKFIQITYTRLDDLLTLGSRQDTVAEDIRTGYTSSLDYIRSLLYMFLYNNDISAFTDSENVNTFVECKLNSLAVNCTQLFYKYSHLPLSCAICIYPTMLINIPQDKVRCTLASDSFTFFKLTMAYDIIKNDITALKGREHEKPSTSQ